MGDFKRAIASIKRHSKVRWQCKQAIFERITPTPSWAVVLCLVPIHSLFVLVRALCLSLVERILSKSSFRSISLLDAMRRCSFGFDHRRTCGLVRSWTWGCGWGWFRSCYPFFPASRCLWFYSAPLAESISSTDSTVRPGGGMGVSCFSTSEFYWVYTVRWRVHSPRVSYGPSFHPVGRATSRLLRGDPALPMVLDLAGEEDGGVRNVCRTFVEGTFFLFDRGFLFLLSFPPFPLVRFLLHGIDRFHGMVDVFFFHLFSGGSTSSSVPIPPFLPSGLSLFFLDAGGWVGRLTVVSSFPISFSFPWIGGQE